jgi:hypothetical protein
MLSRAAAVVLFAASLSTQGVHASPRLPTAGVSILHCAYHLLASNEAVLSVDAYARDDFRSAIEYRFRDKKGRVVVSDIGFMTLENGTTYDGVSFHDERTKADLDEGDFFWIVVGYMGKCHVKDVGDLMLPEPKPRRQWRWVDLSKET